MSEVNVIPPITALSLNDVNLNTDPPPVFFVMLEIERLFIVSESEHSSVNEMRVVEERVKEVMEVLVHIRWPAPM